MGPACSPTCEVTDRTAHTIANNNGKVHAAIIANIKDFYYGPNK